MKNFQTFSALALGALTASSAFALTDGPYNVYYPSVEGVQLTSFSSTIDIPKFNVAGGTLTSISITLAGSIQANQKAESLDNAPASLTLTTDATLTLKRPDNTPIVITIPEALNHFSASIFDNTIDFGGTSGVTFTAAPGNSSDNQVLSGASDLALFTGAGNVTLPISGSAGTSATGAGNIISQFSTSANVHATVTYTYSTTQVPEPKVYGAIGAVACLGLLGYRRFRNGQAAKA
ncbi:MAG TPA: choice-of-anchor E domain-containing protein [Candidatus Limnocylindria bacterium]|jgi:hypothetical protein|nr:choice-of-anchor E domain-containing protein [Candidatus Limnocylindria bacterium]